MCANDGLVHSVPPLWVELRTTAIRTCEAYNGQLSHQLVAISNSLAWPTMRSERRSALADGLFNGDLERRGSWMATAPLPPSWPSRTPSSFRSLVVASVRVRKAQNAH